MSRGGKRTGAGRPQGSVTRPQIRKHFTDKEIKDLVADLKKRAKNDPFLLKFLAEQIFGKATQPLAGEDEDGVRHPITGVVISKDKNGA